MFLPVLKWVRLKEFGYIPNNVKSVTVSMKNGRYYVSCLTHKVKDERIITSNEGIDIDFGLKNQFITKTKLYRLLTNQNELENLRKN